MALNNATNVKELPQLEEIVDGNYLIVENNQGTYIIDFVDFVVGPNNVSFYSTVESLCSKQASLSATVNSQMQTLSTNVLSAVNLKVSALTANYPRYFEVYPNTIAISNGNKSGRSDFNSELGNIRVNDINVIPTNSGAATMTWALFLSSVQNPGSPPSPTPYTYTITISSPSDVSSDAIFETKVLKYF